MTWWMVAACSDHVLRDQSSVVSTDHNGCGLLDDGSVVCWGESDRDVLDVPTGRFTSLTGGQDYACALDEDGEVVCWGNPTDYTRLATGLPDDPYGILEVPDGPFVQVDGGDSHVCAVREGGEVVCWGNEWDGRTSVPPDIRFQSVSAGLRTTLAIDLDGLVHVWGDNFVGDERPAGRFRQVSAGWDYGCGLTEKGRIECWNVTYDDTPPPDGDAWTWISVGFWHGCATEDHKALSCWGRESFGEVHLRTGPSNEPKAWDGWEQVSADMWTTCGRTKRGEFGCWGHDGRDQTVVPASHEP